MPFSSPSRGRADRGTPSIGVHASAHDQQVLAAFDDLTHDRVAGDLAGDQQSARGLRIGQQDQLVLAQLAVQVRADPVEVATTRSEEHTSELQSLMRISYAVFCLKKKNRR